MIYSVNVVNHLGEELEMVLADPEKSGLAITDITGLGEPDADINIIDLASTDYGYFNSARLTKRNVVITIVYYGDDIENSRHIANKFFPTKKKIRLKFKTDYRECYLDGYVEKNTPNIFNKASGCQISMICPDPFLYTTELFTTDFSGIAPLFHFPFTDSNPDEIQFGEYRIVKDKSIYYVGEAEAGVTINIRALGLITGLKIYNVDTSEQMGIDDDALKIITGSKIIQNDEIIINTYTGQKSAILIRNGITYNIINALNKNPKPNWFKLSNGDNLFTYTATTGEFDVVLIIKHRVLYKGL